MDVESHEGAISSNSNGARAVVSRELSFSNGISSSSPRRLEEECGEDGEDLEMDSSNFSFIRLSSSEDWQRKSKNDELHCRNPERDDLPVSVSDEEFELEFGDSNAAATAAAAGSSKFNNGFVKLDDLHNSDDRVPLVRTVLITLLYVLLWYTFSTCLTLYNKLLLGKRYGRFPAPLLMNTIHFSMQAVVSSLMLRFCYPALSPPSMSWRDYIVRVVPTGVATALDVDLTNASLVFITVTFVTMCKSATPVFLLFFAFLFRIETPNLKLFGIILIISFGVLLTVAKETEFSVTGFSLVMLASVSSGFRWVVTQLLLQREEYGLNNPLAAMSYLTPIMALVTAVFSFILEPWHTLSESEYFNTRAHTLESCMLMLLGGSLAFFMVMAEYILISKTSAVTMTVAGVVKEIVTITGAILYFGDPFTLLKGVGLAIIMLGVSLFNWFKYESLVRSKKTHKASSDIEIGKVEAKYTILEDVNL